MSASSLAEPLPAAAHAESDRADVPRWTFARRVAFRFVFSFLGLTFFPFPLDTVPFIAQAWTKVSNAIIVAAGRSVFGLTIGTTFNGSGDKTADWVQLFVIAIVAMTATVVWSVADRKAVSYPRLHRWFHVYLRFALSVAM